MTTYKIYILLLCSLLGNNIDCYSQIYDEQLKKLNCTFPTSSAEFWDNDVPSDYETELLDNVLGREKHNVVIIFQYDFDKDSVEIYNENIEQIWAIDSLETDRISGSTSIGFFFDREKYKTEFIYVKFKKDNKCVKIYPSKHYRIIYLYWFLNREFFLQYKNRFIMTI